MIGKVRTAVANAYHPVYCTAPFAALLRQNGLNPAKVALDNISRRAAIRTRRLDPRHPLRLRWEKSFSALALSRLARSCRDILASAQLDQLVNPPLKVVEPRIDSLIGIGGPRGTRQTRAGRFRNFLRILPRSDVLIYSNGSKLSNRNTGSVFVIFKFGIQVFREDFPLGQHK